MPLPLLALPVMALLAVCACTPPEPAPTTPQAELQAPNTQGNTPQAPGALSQPPSGPPGGAMEGAPEAAVGPAPDGKKLSPPPPPGGTPAQFEAEGETLRISVKAQGFGPKAELQILELVEEEAGAYRPRVVHIEPLKGRSSLEITAPAELPGDFHLIVMDGEPPNIHSSGLQAPLRLEGQDLKVEIQAGQQATWMSQLPLGEPPKNTAGEEAGTPPPMPQGDAKAAPQ